jgi:tRNA U55 pseudouridine synthase TruB
MSAPWRTIWDNGWALEEAVSLERLEEAFQHGQEGEYLRPMDEALLDLPAMVLSPADARRIIQGQAVSSTDEGEPAECRAYSSAGEFLAIVTYDPVRSEWRPHKVFAS